MGLLPAHDFEAHPKKPLVTATISCAEIASPVWIEGDFGLMILLRYLYISL